MRKEKKRLPFLLALLFFQKMLCAQLYMSAHLGGSVGLVAAFGNRFDKMGICLHGYYVNESIQLNADLRFYGNIRNLGPPGFYPEGSASLGIVYGFGKKDTLFESRILSNVSNQTGWASSVGYSQNIYFNQIGTTQRTGTFALQFRKFSLFTENDILARSYYDRFRTGAMVVQYAMSNTTQIALNCTMWTGQMEHRCADPDYPYAFGYMDTTGSRFAEYSHGLLSIQAKTILPYFDYQGQASIGVDAEQVRNAVQNRVIHDLIFLPKKWRSSRNCHMPMLDEDGNQYLYKPGQKIKKPTAYYNLFLNPLLFY